jgi:thiol-disulfide isomerase/thioredoxin
MISIPTIVRTIVKRTGLAGLCLALLLCAACEADSDKASAGNYEALEADLAAAWKKAETQEDRDKVIATFGKKFLEFGTKNPRDPRAVDALLVVVQVVPQGDKAGTRVRALEALQKDHLKTGSPALRKKLKVLANRPGDDEAFDLVRQVATRSDDVTTRAWACKALIQGYERRVDLAERLEKGGPNREQIEKALGAKVVRRLLDKAPDNRLKLRQFRKKLATQYASVFPDLSIGKPAPELVCEDLEGKKVKLSDYKGKVVVLDFWTTWCGYCIRMIPHERELVKRMKDKPFVLVSISADASKETVKRFHEKTPMPWTHWYIGATSEVIDTWNIEGFPTILVLDHKGIIRYKDVRDKRMDDAVETLLKEMEEGN